MTNPTAEFISFELDGTEWKSTRVCISDLGAIRETIRMERRQCARGSAPEVQGILMAQPITTSEVWDYALGAPGSALILFNCVHRANQTFEKSTADRMVMEGHEFVQRLFVESRLLDPTSAPKSSSPDS